MKKQPIIPFLISNVYICVIMDNSDSIKHPSVTPEEAVKEARHVTWVGFWCNAALGTAKVIAGIVGRSGALVADGIHSFSDFITDVIVLVMVGIARRRPNARYQYGHGKYETFATMLIAVDIHRRDKACDTRPARPRARKAGMDCSRYMLRLDSGKGVVVSLHSTRRSKNPVRGRHCKRLASQVRCIFFSSYPCRSGRSDVSWRERTNTRSYCGNDCGRIHNNRRHKNGNSGNKRTA